MTDPGRQSPMRRPEPLRMRRGAMGVEKMFVLSEAVKIGCGVPWDRSGPGLSRCGDGPPPALRS